MNKIILNSPEYTIVSTDNSIYIINSKEDICSTIPKDLISEIVNNLGLYSKFQSIIEEKNKKIEKLNNIINNRNSEIRNLKQNCISSDATFPVKHC